METSHKASFAWFTMALMALALSVATGAWARNPPLKAPDYDLIIRNGMVFDGSGRPARRADIAIKGGRIIRIGALGEARAADEEDAKGLYVTPGFISLHDHSDPAAYDAAGSLLTQGVTTAITNGDGRGGIEIRQQLSSGPRRPSINFGAYIGFNAIWESVIGSFDRRPTAAELETMRGMVATNLETGAWGLSAGLDYKPAYFATTSEVVSVASAAKNWRSNFPNHERVSEANGQSSLAGIAETIAIGKAAGLMPIITHMKLQGKDRGKTAELFAALQASKERGVRPGADAYPYTYGHTPSLLQLLFPAWAQEGGRAAVLARLANRDQRSRIVPAINEIIADRWNGSDNVYFPQRNQDLSTVMRAHGATSAGEAVIEIYERGDEPVILHYGTEDDLVGILSNPLVAISCDCGAKSMPSGHPRYWGAFPRFLGRYVREREIVSWSEAVRKLTALPAAMLGFTQRGYLLPGMVADITIFDPKTILDRATIENPTQPSVGIQSVIVNGSFALRNGQVTGASSGELLFRSGRKPSRPMNLDVDRTATGHGAVMDPRNGAQRLAFRLDISQKPNAQRPTGRFRLIDESGTIQLEMTEPSIIQTTEDWASITGIGRSTRHEEEPVTIIVEAADPSKGGKPSITVTIRGDTIASGVVEGGGIRIRQEAANLPSEGTGS